MNIEPWQGLLGVLLTVAGSYAASRYAGKSSVRVKEIDVAGRAYTQADDITRGLIAALRSDIDALRTEVAGLSVEVRALKDHNNLLIAYTYRIIDVLRRNNLEGQIPQPPPTGIHL